MLPAGDDPAGIQSFAPVLAGYLEALIAQGFSHDDAMLLVVALQTATVAKIKAVDSAPAPEE